MSNSRKQNFQQEIQKLIRNNAVFSYSEKVAVGSVNGGTVYTMLPAVRGFKYKLLDWTVIALGGTTAGGTSLIIKGTISGSATAVVTIALAQMARGVVNKAGSTATFQTDDAGLTDYLDKETGITVEANGTFTGATHFYVEIHYQLEKA